jgi:hypothetical protein
MYASENHSDLYTLYKRIILKDISIFQKCCMQFLYKRTRRGEMPSTLIFAKRKLIFEMDYDDETIRILYSFSEPFGVQPSHFSSNETQDIFVVASENDGMWINIQDNKDADLD